MFIDHAEIFVKAGDGGDGCQSFSKIKYQRFKRPDGGNGGKGGDIIVKVDTNCHSLVDFYYRKHFKAHPGQNGSGNNRNGASGKDCLIKVPLGTVIKDKFEPVVYCDLKEEGQNVILAKGGSGGKGNSRHRDATPGEPGEEKELLLELKLIADVGIIGFPNVGKSSLLSKLSNAKPRIADFPFTTKTPLLGVVRLDSERSFVVCDIPGLIEGAHSGRGMGDAFLRHVERTKVLIHMIDMAALDGREPLKDFSSINKELGLYAGSLLNKPQVLVANKMDLPQAEDNLENFRKRVKKTIYPISCVTGEGIKKLLEAVYKEL